MAGRSLVIMKCFGQLKVMYMGMFIVMLLKSVSSAPGRMKRKSFEGKSEGRLG